MYPVRTNNKSVRIIKVSQLETIQLETSNVDIVRLVINSFKLPNSCSFSLKNLFHLCDCYTRAMYIIGRMIVERKRVSYHSIITLLLFLF